MSPSRHQTTAITSLKRGMGAFMRIAVLATAVTSGAVSLALADPAAAAIKNPTNIASQELGSALRVFAADRHLQILYTTNTVANRRTSGAVGEFTVDEALTRLLGGTGLVFRYVDENTITVMSQGDSVSASERSTSLRGAENGGDEKRSFWSRFRLAQTTQGERRGENSAEVAGDQKDHDRVQPKKRMELEEVVVTGTNIRGAQPSSPLVTITQAEMRLAGHSNLGEVLRALPQNFNGGQNPGIQIGLSAGDNNNRNTTGGSGFNLRGLGPDATLTLLNGARLPYDGFIQATDASVIPVAAIERVEVLLDGASAIYGSDAVGGVVNLILKRDYDGAELSTHFGAATDGGYEQQQYTAVVGKNWGSGGFLASGDISRNTSVRAKQRDYLSSYPSQDAKLYPDSDQEGVLLSGHQKLADFAEGTLDAFYTERSGRFLSSQLPFVLDGSQESTIWGVMPALRFDLPHEWSLSVRGGIGKNESTGISTARDVNTGVAQAASGSGYSNRTEMLGVEFEGPIFALPGGDARLSTGGGYLEHSFRSFRATTGATINSGNESNDYLYGEINLPVVSSAQQIPLVHELSINGSVRRDDYQSFGATTTPKFGVIWSLARSFGIKANWGRSFKAPTLQQRLSRFYAMLNDSEVYPGAPAGRTIVFTSGGNPNLAPERAEVVTAGFVFKPELLPGLHLELGWFDIRYKDRVVQPITPFIQALVEPAFSPFVVINPRVDELDAVIAAAPAGLEAFATRPYEPANVYALFYNHNVNALTQHTHGIDLRASYTKDLLGGNFVVSGNTSWVESRRKVSPLAPEIDASGRSFFPAEFRGRISTSWSRNGLTLSSFVNHIGGVQNNLVAAAARGESMTTLDLVMDYQMESDLVGDVGINLSISNVLNEEPPFMTPSIAAQLPYDTTNYSALGRIVSATLTKRF
jgi:outer membrane receptor protein involved in Fe transport